jgi:hypothetical protein
MRLNKHRPVGFPVHARNGDGRKSQVVPIITYSSGVQPIDYLDAERLDFHERGMLRLQ